MSEQESTRQRVSDLDADVDPQRISDIVGVTVKTVWKMRVAKENGKGGKKWFEAR
uniref:Uncharacterized protein n=1 Tax=Lepeophtheirus salmonis TaxID=72036 RepID=A0A0K2V9R7_LEPSM